jgi:hypothetical protein
LFCSLDVPFFGLIQVKIAFLYFCGLSSWLFIFSANYQCC